MIWRTGSFRLMQSSLFPFFHVYPSTPPRSIIITLIKFQRPSGHGSSNAEFQIEDASSSTCSKNLKCFCFCFYYPSSQVTRRRHTQSYSLQLHTTHYTTYHQLLALLHISEETSDMGPIASYPRTGFNLRQIKIPPRNTHLYAASHFYQMFRDQRLLNHPWRYYEWINF